MTNRPSALRVLAVAAALLVAVSSGCGLSANSQPQVIEASDLPPELLTANPSSSTTLAASPATTSATVYFLTRQDGVTRLVPVQREMADATRPGDRLIALLGTPTAEEAAAGIITSIPSDTVLLDTELDDATDELRIELSRALFDVQGEELRNAFAQLVWTATDLDGVRRVTFVIDGQTYRVPDDAGIEQPGPVGRANYRSLAPLG
jgi:spore germination protein GerM